MEINKYHIIKGVLKLYFSDHLWLDWRFGATKESFIDMEFFEDTFDIDLLVGLVKDYSDKYPGENDVSLELSFHADTLVIKSEHIHRSNPIDKKHILAAFESLKAELMKDPKVIEILNHNYKAVEYLEEMYEKTAPKKKG